MAKNLVRPLCANQHYDTLLTVRHLGIYGTAFASQKPNEDTPPAFRQFSVCPVLYWFFHSGTAFGSEYLHLTSSAWP